MGTAYKKPMGRPPLLNDELQEKVCQLIKAGNYIETACTYCGISKGTLYNWLKRGREEVTRVEGNPKARYRKSEQMYVNFLNAVDEAVSFSEIRDLKRLDAHAEDNPNVLMWRLERRHPSRWGRQKIEADVKHSGDVRVNINIRGEDEDEQDM